MFLYGFLGLDNASVGYIIESEGTDGITGHQTSSFDLSPAGIAGRPLFISQFIASSVGGSYKHRRTVSKVVKI